MKLNMSKKEKRIKAGSAVVVALLGMAMLGGGLWMVYSAIKGFLN